MRFGVGVAAAVALLLIGSQHQWPAGAAHRKEARSRQTAKPRHPSA